MAIRARVETIHYNAEIFKPADTRCQSSTVVRKSQKQNIYKYDLSYFPIFVYYPRYFNKLVFLLHHSYSATHKKNNRPSPLLSVVYDPLWRERPFTKDEKNNVKFCFSINCRDEIHEVKFPSDSQSEIVKCYGNTGVSFADKYMIFP